MLNWCLQVETMPTWRLPRNLTIIALFSRFKIRMRSGTEHARMQLLMIILT